MNNRFLRHGELTQPEERGPKGRKLCKFCRTKEVAKGRRYYCSRQCSEEVAIRSNGSYMRFKVKERDKGICSLCQLDTVKFHYDLSHKVFKLARRFQFLVFKELGLPPSYDLGTTLWHADHIIPVVEGGGQCGLENIRTLCYFCHKEETKLLKQRLARKPKKIRQQEENLRLARSSNPHT